MYIYKMLLKKTMLNVHYETAVKQILEHYGQK